MKKVFFIAVAIAVSIGFSACSNKAPKKVDNYYDRANKAAAESHNGLAKD